MSTLSVDNQRVLRNTFLILAGLPWVLLLLLLGIALAVPAVYEGGDFTTGHCVSSDFVCSVSRGTGSLALVYAIGAVVWAPLSAVFLITGITFAVLAFRSRRRTAQEAS